MLMRGTTRRLALAVATAAAVGLGTLGALPASASTAKAHVTNIQIIPAFDHDFPLSGHQFSNAAQPQQTQAPAASFVCTLYASDPFWEDTGSVIGGQGWQSCSGSDYQNTKITVAIQTYTGLGFWDNRVVDSEGWSSSYWLNLYNYWDCVGSGTQTYRIVTTGWADSGDYGASVQSTHYARVTCVA